MEITNKSKRRISTSQEVAPVKTLNEIDLEIQRLLKKVIVEDGNIAEIKAIEKSIQEAEQSAVEAGRKIVSFALLIQLSAA